ncbi:translocator protein-like [Ischnura elegans]|uniref:translocator protein-like n=1 Tax=Ischnura elegans TaxID=197161 RepID=UPI001ED8BBD8|nr:translocator protein-like [Ischnura elegans]XP_046382543.1 translocator protein-like [Ischnura elegans]
MPVIWEAVGATLLPHVGGYLNGLIVRPQLKTWYKDLKKPSWCPPNAAFPVAWTTLYTGMGYASYLVWRDGGGFDGDARLPLALYASQLALNWAWSPIFFHYHSFKWSMVNITLLWGNVAACAYYFWEINRPAGLLMVPYLGWLTLAAAITYRIWQDNPPKDSKEETRKK